MKIVLTILVMGVLIILLKLNMVEHYSTNSNLQINYEKSKQNYDIFLMDYNSIPETESLKREKAKFKLDYLESEKILAELKYMEEIETEDETQEETGIIGNIQEYIPIYEKIKSEYNKNRLDIPDIYTSKYQILDDSISDLDSYYSDIYNYSNQVDNLTNNYGKFHKVSKRKINNINNDSTDVVTDEDMYEPLNPFENLAYNKALITATKMQYVEDVNLHKMNELI